MKKLISVVLCLALALSLGAMAFAQEPETAWDENHETILLENGAAYGEGETTFSFAVECQNETALVTGEDGEWGLYVKTINGITADYDTDGSYWAFYIDGEYAMTGVDATEIDTEATYSFVISK